MSAPFRPTLSGQEFSPLSPALFHLTLQDGELTCLSGQAPTFVRATSGTALDAAGRLSTIPNHIPRIDAVLNSVTGLYEPTVLLEPTRINLCLQSENFGTTWAAVGTPTRTAAALTIGDLVLDLIGDDAAGTLEGYTQTVTCTGNAVKAVSLRMAAGTSMSTMIRLRDTTAGADRLLAAVTWAAGVPTVVMTTGAAVGAPLALASGAYAFGFQTASVTAANTNSLQVYPASTAALAVANTGTVYVGGVQAEDAPMPSSYLKTTTATVTRNGEALSYPALWPLQDNETWYVRMARPNWADMAGTLMNCYGAVLGTSPKKYLLFDSGNRRLYAECNDGTTVATIYAAIPSGTGGFIEAAIQWANLKTAGKARLDIGAGYGADSNLTGPISSFAPTLAVGSDGSGFQLTGGLTDLVVAQGLQTLATLRGIAGR
jgi:hypothetical protein